MSDYEKQRDAAAAEHVDSVFDKPNYTNRVTDLYVSCDFKAGADWAAEYFRAEIKSLHRINDDAEIARRSDKAQMTKMREACASYPKMVDTLIAQRDQAVADAKAMAEALHKIGEIANPNFKVNHAISTLAEVLTPERRERYLK